MTSNSFTKCPGLKIKGLSNVGGTKELLQKLLEGRVTISPLLHLVGNNKNLIKAYCSRIGDLVG